MGTGTLNFREDRYNLIMMIPTSVRVLAAVAGSLLVLSAVASVIGTVIVPRRSGSRLTRLVTRAVDNAFQLVTRPVSDYKRRDRIEAAQAPVILSASSSCGSASLRRLCAAGLARGTGYHRGVPHRRPALWTFGSSQTHGFFETAVLDTAAMAALITVTLQIAYLPQLYGAFNRRETEIALLNSWQGSPSWGPELLARTHYALGSGTSALDTLPELYNQWERWAVDVAESHVTYSPLVWFRSPTYEASWVTSLLAVLDSAALYLSLSPQAAPNVPARLCLRSGLLCFGQVARSMGLEVPAEPDPDAGIDLPYDDYLNAIARLREMNFPIERDPAHSWPDFVGWRVNYEQAAYAIAEAIDAVPALWSGPRRHQATPMPPLRPLPGRPPSGE